MIFLFFFSKNIVTKLTVVVISISGWKFKTLTRPHLNSSVGIFIFQKKLKLYRHNLSKRRAFYYFPIIFVTVILIFLKFQS